MSEPAHEPSAQPNVDSPATATADEDLLAALADEVTARLRRGEHPKVEDYVERHPPLAERIRKVFQAVTLMEQTRSMDFATRGERPGDTIGRYKLLERIGEGGFGVVYMAEQQQPVRRKVALKVVKPGMDSRQVLARFEAERQALAIMDHPNIAKVFDGGMTDSGRPYFVMELVKGVPITEFCDQQQLAPRQRLELFGHVCDAVQHAHQKGIIHRDIKPSNVLVIMHDTTPLVKVIDFGVAKALGQELTDKTMFTGFAQLLGTPLYMSPEQAGQSALDIDTRSDIYSLGVLLYELLTGTTPFDKERFKKAAQEEIRRIIREEEPPRPSTRLSESKDSLASISAQRRIEPAKLTKLVRGELDWIVMKALEKDRNRRYETANAFAMDVQRYLADEPVLACPPSAGYRLRKFVRRNKRTLITSALLGAMLLVVAGSFGWMARDRAVSAGGPPRQSVFCSTNARTRCVPIRWTAKPWHWERRSSERPTAGRSASPGGWTAAAPTYALLRELEAADALGWTWINDELGGRPSDNEAVEARLRVALANYGMVPGKTPASDATGRVNSSLVRERLLAALDLWLAFEASTAERLAGHPHRAWVRDVLRSADPDPYRDAVRSAALAEDLATLASLLGQPQALSQPARYAAVLGLLEVVPPDRRRAILESALLAQPGSHSLLMGLGISYPKKKHDRDGVRERVRWFQAAVAARPKSAAAHSSLGGALRDSGNFDQALAHFRLAIELEPKSPVDHINLADTLLMGGHAGAADALVSLQTADNLAPNNSSVHTSLAFAYFATGDPIRGTASFRQALEIDPNNARARGALGSVLLMKGERDNAIAEFREGLRRNPNDAGIHCALGLALQEKGDVDGAIAEYQAAIQIEPDVSPAQDGLASILATGPDRVRDGKLAVVHATRACELSGWKQPSSIATLAAAHAEAEEFDKAVAYQKQALSFPDFDKSERGGGQARLELYSQKKAYRDPSLSPGQVTPPQEAKP